jgi:D-tyrosyl-tRNA(Tyr) deacylase
MIPCFSRERTWQADPMRVLVQRALNASVRVHGEVTGSFTGPGIVALVGVTHTDTEAVADAMASKTYSLRIFDHAHLEAVNVCVPPGSGREVSAADGQLPVLVISQFTLYANTRKGRRPTWDAAAPGDVAEPLVDRFSNALRNLGAPVSTGVFGADMKVTFTNDGPFTVLLDSDSST